MPVPHESLAHALDRDGFVRLDGSFFEAADLQASAARALFLSACTDLPDDESGLSTNRRRRYGTFVLLPWSGTLESVPPTWDAARATFMSRYAQAAHFNPEQNGEIRHFAPLTPQLAESPYLHWLIRKAFALVATNLSARPVWVGCHIISLVAHPSRPGRSTPDLIHRDGEPYTIAALLERTGVTGGENIVTTPDVEGRHPDDIDARAILERFTLETPWEGWMLCDERVAHYVSPVEVREGASVGRRTVLLVDFTPMQPAFLEGRSGGIDVAEPRERHRSLAAARAMR